MLKRTIVFILLTSMLVLFNTNYETVYCNGITSLELSVNTARIGVNGQIKVTVSAESVSDLYAYEIVLEYDTDKLEFIKAENKLQGFSVSPLLNEGKVTYAATKLGNADGDTGDKDICIFTFSAKKSGNAEVGISMVKLLDSKLTNIQYSKGEALEINIINGSGQNPSDSIPTPNPPPVKELIMNMVETIHNLIDSENASTTEISEAVKQIINEFGKLDNNSRDELTNSIKEVLEKAMWKISDINPDCFIKESNEVGISISFDKDAFRKQISSVKEELSDLSKKLTENGLENLNNLLKKQVRIRLDVDNDSETKFRLQDASLIDLSNAGFDFVIDTGAAGLIIPPQLIPIKPDDMKNAYLEISLRKLKNRESEEYLNSVGSGENAGMLLLGSIYEFNAYMANGEGTERINKFDKKVYIEISIEDREIFNKDKLGVYYYNDMTRQWEYVGGRINKRTGRIEFSTGHFSLYSVMEYNKKFIDMEGHWAKNDVEIAASKHIIFGMDNSSFQPDGNVTRAQFTAMLIRMLNLDLDTYRGSFEDVPSKEWYADYVQTAVDFGIVRGDGSSFRPEASITREEMAVMAMRAYDNIEKNQVSVNENVNRLEDEEKISTWALDAVKKAHKSGIIKGVPGNRFAPEETATRAQAAVIIRRLIDRMEVFYD